MHTCHAVHPLLKGHWLLDRGETNAQVQERTGVKSSGASCMKNTAYGQTNALITGRTDRQIHCSLIVWTDKHSDHRTYGQTDTMIIVRMDR